MLATHEILVKFTIVQEVESVNEIIDPHDVASTAANLLADELTEFNAVTSYEIVEGKMEAK